jgi:hypothetical protein
VVEIMMNAVQSRGQTNHSESLGPGSAVPAETNERSLSDLLKPEGPFRSLGGSLYRSTILNTSMNHSQSLMAGCYTNESVTLSSNLVTLRYAHSGRYNGIQQHTYRTEGACFSIKWFDASHLKARTIQRHQQEEAEGIRPSRQAANQQ